MKLFKDLVAEHAKLIDEIMPWDLEQKLLNTTPPIILDIREPKEFDILHIRSSINVPRGILELACDYNYSETYPELVKSRGKDFVIVCRSGNRSVLATYTMKQMGYKKVASLRTGLKGWNDYEQPLVNNNNQKINIDEAEIALNPKVKPEQLSPK